MREYNKVSGIRSDRPMTTKEIITTADNLREVERVANSYYGPVVTTILTTISVVGMLVYFVVPLFMMIFN